MIYPVMTSIDELLSKVRRRGELQLPPPETRRLLRELNGLTQQDMGDGVGVSREAVSRWEAGLRTPRGELLERYRAVLDRLAAEVGS